MQDVFCGVPLNYSLRASAAFMDSSGKFSQLRVDYEKHGKIQYRVNYILPLPNSAKEVFYEKWEFETRIDSLVQDTCPRYASSLELHYSTKANATKDLTLIRKHLAKFPFACHTTIIVDKSRGAQGYQLAAQHPAICKLLQLELLGKKIRLTYH